ncbi:ABC transporter ATP-binding protein [Paenibacillus psychroresistens]|uniref:ABC transporter ATP-binding protein n=2 Tax=Paenibacillus psychroresistens TaxID=1778678 RepID=A0A6B8S0B6_9BACL|nr:ABC transporter ATP-binding protein [Paenibacillus psychroresistens]
MLTFNVLEGRCVALLGPNGAGKTTTLQMLSGLLAPSSGTIGFEGTDELDIRQSIGYLPQYPAFYNWMSGKEFLEFTGKLAHLSQKEAALRASNILDRVGLKDAAKRRIGGYSGGMKQRLGLAQAIIHRPKLLLLDEPVSSLDPIGRSEVLELMQELKQETTILFSTHVLHDAEAICDDVLIIRDGQIVLNGELGKIMLENQQPIISIALSSNDQIWLHSLANKPYVIDFETQHNAAKITVNDLELAKVDLLKEIVDRGISIMKFEVAQSTLEDLFMKVVAR